tara:strand:+ start:2633 stop:2809 length:177 start_codon:yes stop_codon:yes gene_type:complete
MLTDKQKINRLEIIIDRLMYKLEENEDIYYFMIERDDYEEIERDYEHYEKEKRNSRNE